MSTTLQLSDLQTAVRQRADQENSQFISDLELTSYINQSYFELYDLLVQSYGDDYFVAPFLQLTTDGVTDQFPLPDGALYSGAPACLKLLAVDLQLTAHNWEKLHQFDMAQRNASHFQAPRYRILGSNLWLRPFPKAGLILRLIYVPRLQPLINPTDLVDQISGWAEYIIIDAAIKCLLKEESDVSVLLAQKQAMAQRIQSASANRDAGSPATVADNAGFDFWGCEWR